MSTARKAPAKTAGKSARKAAPKAAAKPVVKSSAKASAKAANVRRKAPAKAAARSVLPALPAPELYDEALAFAQAQATDASSSLFEGYDRIAMFHKRTVDAVIESGHAVARGVEDIGKLWVDLGQLTLQDGAVLVKTFAGVRTLQELVEVQADLTRLWLGRLFTEGQRLSELSARVANEAVTPLRARLDSVLGQVLKQAAA